LGFDGQAGPLVHFAATNDKVDETVARLRKRKRKCFRRLPKFTDRQNVDLRMTDILMVGKLDVDETVAKLYKRKRKCFRRHPKFTDRQIVDLQMTDILMVGKLDVDEIGARLSAKECFR
jgi:hypothetical protein